MTVVPALLGDLTTGAAAVKAFSLDLRQRIVDAIDRNETQVQVAARFEVSVQFVRKLLRQRRTIGSIAPKPHGGGRAAAFDAESTAKLRQAVKDHNDATLAELAQHVGIAVVPSVVHRALTAAGITRKKSPGGRPSKTAPT